jgi:hypothetical protein
VSVFRSAVTAADGTVNVGYLSLFWIMIVVLNVIPWMCVFTAVDAFGYNRPFDVRSLGYGVGAVCADFLRRSVRSACSCGATVARRR